METALHTFAQPPSGRPYFWKDRNCSKTPLIPDPLHLRSFFTFLVLLVCFLCAAKVSEQSAVRDYRVANEHALLSEFIKFLSIPNVASDTANIRRDADYLVVRMKQGGLNPR